MNENSQEILVDGYVRVYLERASYVAASFCDDTIRTAYVLWAVLSDDNIFSNYLEEGYGLIFTMQEFCSDIINDPSTLCEIFGSELGNTLAASLSTSIDIDKMKELIEKVEKDVAEHTENAKKENGEEIRPKSIKFHIFNPSINMLDGELYYSQNLMAIMQDAMLRSVQARKTCVDFPNFLYSLIAAENTTARKYFDIVEFPVDEVLEDLNQLFYIDDAYDYSNPMFKLPKNIAEYCRVLNFNYTSDQVSDILGRDIEIKLAWNTASKKTKKNVVLVGPPGCGKTAIVEAMALSIVNGTCPKRFKNYMVIELDISSMMAGTSYRGQFEEKAVELIKFLESTPNIILFVDELHHLLGAGSTSGSTLDLSGILKPLLARDDAVVIGATTTEEYYKYIATHGAFSRRFKLIEVKEPKYDKVKEMVSKRIENLSKFHKVSISDEIIDYIIIQACCFSPETSNPDKTISLCDESMAIAKNKNKKVLTKSHVNEVNMLSYKKFKCLDKDYKLHVAYHEAAHYVASRVLPTRKVYSTILVSIIPTNWYSGIHQSELNESVPNYSDIASFKEEMIVLMAGRAAEKFFTNMYTAGARNDLMKITRDARNMILNYGMIEEGDYFNVCLMGDDSDDPTFLGEKAIEYANAQTKKLVDEIWTLAFKLVEEHKDSITRIAKALTKSGMLTADELDRLFKGEKTPVKNSEKTDSNIPVAVTTE